MLACDWDEEVLLQLFLVNHVSDQVLELSVVLSVVAAIFVVVAKLVYALIGFMDDWVIPL